MDRGGGVRTTRQEGEELGIRCRERARAAQPALDAAITREEALGVHKVLAKEVVGDVVKTCIRVLVREATRLACERADTHHHPRARGGAP